MKVKLFLLFSLTCLCAGSVSAQYTEKWSTQTDGYILYAFGNTDADPQVELLVGGPGGNGEDSLFLLDGLTGAVEWSYGEESIYMGIYTSAYSAYSSDFGPNLVDVDADGVLEIVFQTFYISAPSRYHCYDSDVSVGVRDDEHSPLPESVKLGQNFPNPFNPTTEISFSVPKAGHVTLTVFNILGQKLATLVDQELSAGEHSVIWDGRNEKGETAASGVYFYSLQTAEASESRKMLLVK